MLESLKILGELYGTFKPYDEISADYVVVLKLDSKGNFLGFELEEFSEEKLDKYLYRSSGTSNPPSWTPTMNLNTKNPEKTLKLALNQLQKLTDLGNLKLDNLPNLRRNIENLSKQVKELLKDLPKKVKVLFTVKIDGKYIGEIEQLVEGLKELEKQILEKKASSEGVCAVCGEHKKVYGEGLFPIKFFTLDKPHFIHGGFKRKEYVFPICYDCGLKLREGWKFIEKNLQFEFTSGNNFYLIPELVVEDKEKLKWLIEKRLLESAEKIEGLSEEAKKQLAQDERRILRKISKEGNYFVVHLLFLKKEQQAQRIILYIYGIYPSRIKELFEAKEFVDRLLDTTFNYSVVWNIFKENYQKEFYEYTRLTFKGFPILTIPLLEILLEHLRGYLLENQPLKGFERELTKTLAVYLFALITTGGLKMEDKTSNCVENSTTLEEFLSCFPLLKGDLEKGLFLLGVLTGYLLKIQAARLDGNKPFVRKLKGFKLRKKDFENLYTELLNKLEEYDQAGELPVITKYIKYLIEKTTEYLLSSAEWNISDKEANFIFASGIGLSGRVLEILKEQFKEEETKQEV